MRKFIKEGVDFGKVSEKVAAIIKGKGHVVVMFTDDGMETSDPEEARRFYVKDPNYMVTVDNEAAVIRINKNSNVELVEIEAVLKQIKNLARNYMLKSELKVFGKEIAPKDFAYQAKKLRDEKMNGINEASIEQDMWIVYIPANMYAGKYYEIGSYPYKVPVDVAPTQEDAIEYVNNNQEQILAELENSRVRYGNRSIPRIGPRRSGGVKGNVFFRDSYHVRGPIKVSRLVKEEDMNPINEASFSRMHGHKKTSYQTLESTKLIVRHKKVVDEDVRGSRSRQIKAIFIENNGERFKFPHNNLAGARAMARHIDEGGEMRDAVGSYIIESVGNMIKLAEFMRYTQSNKLINEDSEDIVKIVRENIAAYRSELKRFQGATSYKSMCETVANREGSELEEDTADLKDMFTVRKFDEKIGETLPLIKRLVTEKNVWRSMIEEASTEAFVVTSTENLIEGDAIEFESPTQKMGYKIRTLSERVTEESDLSKFVHKIGNKMIEGKELSKFETSVMRNVLEHIVVVEEEVAEEDGFTDKLEEAMTDFERKMKLLEFDLDWDEEQEELLYKDFYGHSDDDLDDLSIRRRREQGTWNDDTAGPDDDLFGVDDTSCPDCSVMGPDPDCERCGGTGEIFEEPLSEYKDGEPLETVTCPECGDFSMDFQGQEGDYFYYLCDTCGYDKEEYLPPTKDQWRDCEDCEGSGTSMLSGEECGNCGGEGRWLESISEDPDDWDHGYNYEGPQADDLGYDPETQWMDPAGGVHDNDEEDPAKMYEQDPYSGSDIPELDMPEQPSGGPNFDDIVEEVVDQLNAAGLFGYDEVLESILFYFPGDEDNPMVDKIYQEVLDQINPDNIEESRLRKLAGLPLKEEDEDDEECQTCKDWDDDDKRVCRDCKV